MLEGVDSETRGIPPLRPEKDKWTSLQTRMIKTGGRLVRHARRLVFQLAEVLVSWEILTGMLERIGHLRPAPGLLWERGH